MCNLHYTSHRWLSSPSIILLVSASFFLAQVFLIPISSISQKRRTQLQMSISPFQKEKKGLYGSCLLGLSGCKDVPFVFIGMTGYTRHRIHAVWYHPWLDTQQKSIYRNVFVLSSSYNNQFDLWMESVCSRRCQRHMQRIQAT